MYAAVRVNKVAAASIHAKDVWVEWDETSHKYKSNALFLAIIKDDATHCPVCQVPLISIDINKRRCMSCHNYLMYYNDTVDSIVQMRLSLGVYAVDLDTQPVFYYFTPSNSSFPEPTFTGPYFSKNYVPPNV